MGETNSPSVAHVVKKNSDGLWLKFLIKFFNLTLSSGEIS